MSIWVNRIRKMRCSNRFLASWARNCRSLRRQVLTKNRAMRGFFPIAMPSMLDPVFGGTVIYLCEYNSSGALGVIINKPTDMTMEVLFDRIDLALEIIPNRVPIDKKPVMFGGRGQA